MAPENLANRLLRHLTPAAFRLLEAHLEPVDLRLHDILREPNDPITHVYFPEDCLISLVAPLDDGSSPELASVGREGLVGGIAAVGSKESYSRWLIQVAGRALRCPVSDFEHAFRQSTDFRQLIICHFEALLCQTMQSVVCNAVHPVEARYCRWLLTMRDRGDTDDLPLTQEFLAELLSIHRSSVGIVSSTLQKAGFIQARRGVIRIVDRAGLERVACECYRLVHDRYNRLIPGTFD